MTNKRNGTPFEPNPNAYNSEPNPYNLPYNEAIFASTYIPWQHSTRGRRRGALGRGENTIPVAEPRQPNNRDGGAGSRCERDRRGIGLTSVLAEHATQIIDGRRAAGWGERAWGLCALWELGREGPSMDPNIRTLNWAPAGCEWAERSGCTMHECLHTIQ